MYNNFEELFYIPYQPKFKALQLAYSLTGTGGWKLKLSWRESGVEFGHKLEKSRKLIFRDNEREKKKRKQERETDSRIKSK